ncbi:MAG: hypothetical protein H7301_00110 [Cryobacterium sp.]|nr:hypothetical protein [Oligoflexia bacterium]
MMNLKRVRFDYRTIFLMVALIGAASLFVTTLTSEAPESLAEESASQTKPSSETKLDGSAEAKADPEAKPAAPVAKKSTGCLTGEASIQDLQDLKRDLAKREQELKRRESEIAAKESAVQEELKKLDQAKEEIKQTQALGDSKNEEKITKLVETFESMSPKAASAIVSAVDDRLAVEAMSRLSSAKLGKILAAMDPTKSAPLTEKLAGVVRAKRSDTRNPASIGAAGTSTSVKGGEENGNRKQQQRNDGVGSRQPEPALGK